MVNNQTYQSEETNAPFRLDPIGTNEFNGTVRDLHVTKYGHIRATFRLEQKYNKSSPKVTVDFPDLRGMGDYECPIKLGDWINVKIIVERYEHNK